MVLHWVDGVSRDAGDAAQSADLEGDLIQGQLFNCLVQKSFLFTKTAFTQNTAQTNTSDTNSPLHTTESYVLFKSPKVYASTHNLSLIYILSLASHKS